jgi:tetratricopeptide (TPR) repeat protein
MHDDDAKAQPASTLVRAVWWAGGADTAGGAHRVCGETSREKGLLVVSKSVTQPSRWNLRRWWELAPAWVAAVSLLCGVLGAAQSPKTQDLPLAAKERFTQAQELLSRGQVESALAAARQGLKVAPKSVEGYNLLGIIYDQQKDYAQSLAAFQQAIKLNPRSTLSHNNLGRSYSSQEKFDLAVQEFRTALRLDPRNRDANYNLGLILLARGQPQEAISFLGRVQPPDPASLMNLIQANFRTGQTAKALEVSRSLSDLAKDDVRVHFSLGVLLAAEKQYGSAVHEFELADALQPGTFEILHNLGQAHLRNNNQAKAEAILPRALAMQPDSADTLYLLGKLYADQRKYVQAMEMLVRARQLAPQNTDYIFLLSRLSMLQSYFEDAIQLLEEGVKIAPQRPDLHAALGESYFMAGKVDKAIQEFQTLVRLDPSAGAYNFMGLCYRHMGRFEEAKKYFQEGLKLDAKFAPSLFNLGFIENKQGNLERAEKFLEEALRADPNYDDALYELASVKMTQKKFEEALPLLQRCVKVTTKPAQVYYKLAVTERALRQTKAAERDLKIFETLSKEPSQGPYPLQHFIESFDQRVQLSGQERAQLDLESLLRMAKQNPDHPSTLYLLAETYLKLGRPEEAKKWVAELQKLSGGDIRTTLGVGVLLARYGMYPEAIQRFQSALAADPTSGDAKYDLANAYFRIGNYAQALEVMRQLSPSAESDDTMLALLGDIYAHLGRTPEAVSIFGAAVQKNPENEQYYLSLALTHLRAGNNQAAEKSLQQGLARIPNSGKLFWGMGIFLALAGKTEQAEDFLNRAVDLMPEWQSGYATLGLFYYETGQMAKARETLERYARSFPRGGINVGRLKQVMAAAPAAQDNLSKPKSLSPETRQQFLQVALALADQSL